MDRKLQRHRADSLRQHGFLVRNVNKKIALWKTPKSKPQFSGS